MRTLLSSISLIVAACGGVPAGGPSGLPADPGLCPEIRLAGCPDPVCPDGAEVTRTEEERTVTSTCTSAQGVQHSHSCFDGILRKRTVQDASGLRLVEQFHNGRVTLRDSYLGVGPERFIHSQNADCVEWLASTPPVYGEVIASLPANRPLLIRSAAELSRHYELRDPDLQKPSDIDWSRFQVLMVYTPTPDAGKGRHYSTHRKLERSGPKAVLQVVWTKSCSMGGAERPIEDPPSHDVPTDMMVVVVPHDIEDVELRTARTGNVSYESCLMVP